MAEEATTFEDGRNPRFSSVAVALHNTSFRPSSSPRMESYSATEFLPAAPSDVTAGEVAGALAVSKRTVLRQLAAIAANGSRTVRGQLARTWCYTDLPRKIQDALFARAKTQGYRSVEALLLAPGDPWPCPVPLADVAPAAIERAQKLQTAMRPILLRYDEMVLSQSEIEQMGTQEYERVFGHPVSGRHWRRLFERTLRRDRGFEKWDRVEIYLEDNAAKKTPAGTRRHDVRLPDFSCLDTILAGFQDRNSPSAEDRTLLWCHAFETLEESVQEGFLERKVKKALVIYLARIAPFLARNCGALRRTFDRKYAAWKTTNGDVSKIKDGRHERSGWFRRPEITETAKVGLLREILSSGGRIAQGWRQARTNDALPEELAGHYTALPTSKSYVPASIRKAIGPEVKKLDDHAHGPRRVRDRGPHIVRDWSNVHSGDWFQGDDLTAPVYLWREEDPNSPTRGQVLLMIDCRSLYALGFGLLYDKVYNSRDIRNLITVSCESYGLPRAGFYFENGPWRSQILEGLSWSETEVGLRGLGLRFRHATGPQGKVIENVIGRVQCLMEGEMGYCGRDERNDRFERVQRQLQRIRAGAHPAEFLMSGTEWHRRLHEILQTYNGEKQQGELLAGLSPAEAYREFYGDEPLRKLDDSCRYLLSNFKKRVRVGRNGIVFRFGKEEYRYLNEITGRLEGREVVAWFDPERPESLCITDTEEEIPVTVPRLYAVPAMDATKEELSTAFRQIAGHNAYGKRLWQVVSNPFPTEFNRRATKTMTASPAQVQLGERMEAQKIVHAETETQREKEDAKLRRTVGRFGLPIAAKAQQRRDQLEGAQELARLLHESDESTVQGKDGQ